MKVVSRASGARGEKTTEHYMVVRRGKNLELSAGGGREQGDSILAERPRGRSYCRGKKRGGAPMKTGGTEL